MVSVVGRITGENAIETSDGVAVSLVNHSVENMPARYVTIPPAAPPGPRRAIPRSGCVEIVGTIEDGAALSPKRACAFGDDFGAHPASRRRSRSSRRRFPLTPSPRADLKNYDDLVTLMNGKYSSLFQ